MFKIRNAIEAGVLGGGTALWIFRFPLSITAKIIVMCIISLPLTIFALIGADGMSLSEYLVNIIKFLRNKRKLCRSDTEISDDISALRLKIKKNRFLDATIGTLSDRIRIRKAKKYLKLREASKEGKKLKNPIDTESYLPIEKIENGVVFTKDGRYLKILEIEPINFLLRSAREQRNIIYSFVSFLKVAPIKMQFKVLTKKADLNTHIRQVQEEIQNETNEKCRMQQTDYIRFLKQIGSREAVSRRFFLIYEYEPFVINRKNDLNDMFSTLKTVEQSVKNYLFKCGNNVIEHSDEDEFLTDVVYELLNRASDESLQARVKSVADKYVMCGKSIDEINVNEFLAPKLIDFTHMDYIISDGVFMTYMCIPSDGYRSHVMAGWLAILVNAGDGIDVDLFVSKQPKDKVQFKLGQQIRINRSKLKEASDTNTDYDDLEGAITSGYFLKNGLANNEDFYYMNILVTVTARNKVELDWRVNEIKKLLLSQDITIKKCNFQQEQAFNMTMPILSSDKKIYSRTRRNLLTTGVASCYPFTSFEICDDNGILLGVNKHNNSLVIVDLFNSKKYKNANMAILGTSGAGKTFTMQLMALRMRRKNIQVFILAPLKGHEFHRAAMNIGGEFIQISPASSNCINVMEIRKADTTNTELLDGPLLDKSILAGKIQRLHIFFSLLIPDMTYEERQLLDDALVQTYAGKGITHQNESLEDGNGGYVEMPVLGDLYNVLIKRSETKRLANILNRLVNGSAKTFNQQTNVNLDNKYTVIDISELSGDLLTVGMFVGLDYIWDKAKEDRTKEKAIFLDELWQLIGASSNKLAAEFVLEIFKIIRGYGGSAICATQDLNDFFALDDGKYGKGIINNAKTKIILNLEDDEAQRVQNILNLSETELMNITHFERGSGLISTNSNNVTVDFRASDLEKEIITTDRAELQAILDRKRGNTQ
ncbi:MAG: ATP-binding protein [Clostridia bacterium]|nr:ATP-binding protein [Clostridia bacterium]